MTWFWHSRNCIGAAFLVGFLAKIWKLLCFGFLTAAKLAVTWTSYHASRRRRSSRSQIIHCIISRFGFGRLMCCEHAFSQLASSWSAINFTCCAGTIHNTCLSACLILALYPTAICTVSCQSNSLRQLSGTENLQLCSFSQCHLGLLVKKIRKVGINEPLRLHNHWWLTQGKKQPIASHKPTMAVTQRGQYFAEAYVQCIC